MASEGPALREHRAPRSLLPNASKYETPSLKTAFSLTKGFLRGIILLFHKMPRERFLFAIFGVLWYPIIVVHD